MLKSFKTNIRLFVKKLRKLNYHNFLIFITTYVLIHNTFYALLLTKYNQSIASVLFLISGLLLLSYEFIDRKQYDLYARHIFTMILFFVSIMIYHAGWDAGFQYVLVATMTALFLPFYLPDYSKLNKKVLMTIGSCYVLVLMSRCIYGVFFPNQASLLEFDSKTLTNIYCYNAFQAFVIIIMFSYFYINRSKAFHDELTRRADFDELTGLYNRYALNQLLDDEIKKENEMVCIAILDIDFFKNINDTHGHNAGDKILKNISRIADSISNDIVVGRWGGEEFLLLSNKCNYKKFNKQLESLRKEIEHEQFVINKKSVHVTVSIGSTFTKNLTNKIDLIKEADDNLYKAKETGRNKLVTK